MKQFASGVSTRKVAKLVKVNLNTADLFFHKLREIIAEQMASSAPILAGEIEVDKRYIGDVRNGKRVICAGGKVPVFGLLKRGGRIYTSHTNDTI